MKVLHIGKYFAPFKGGVETYLLDVMTALSRRGWDMAALVHNHDHSVRGHSETHGDHGAEFAVRRSGTLLKLFFTPLSPAFRADLRRMVREFRPDVIHVHLPNPSALWLLSLAEARSVPLVIHWHSDVITTEQGALMKALYAIYRPLERKLLQRAAAIIATSPSYLDSSQSLAEFPDKCRVVPLGLDPARFEAYSGAPRPPSFQPGRMNVLAVGRLTYYKGFGVLLRALAKVDGVHVHIVGQGELRRELRALARQLRVARRVSFHGKADDAELAAMLAHCDCVCLPSIERTEAFGLVLLEAMQFGRATIASAVPGSGMGWVVKGDVTGLKVEPRNVTALAGAMATLRDDREWAEQLGRNGRERFDARFTIDRSVDALVDVYQEVAA
ncbi:glycosyltransferase [Marinihelvus fidelis]|uniref:Glycosyltransferase n=1 Tax=Marinihelvus fidelis TaxID=2613842 RepID=A0A5N0TJ93_9GAMM|nr:glycosyltransferase [Marinihelvus fidelis]KAA9133369.1 glycosyltransferase [Marinihelvus fidelis]